MKYMIIIIKTTKRDAVLKSLGKLGVTRLMVSEVRGYGGEPHEKRFRAGSYTIQDAPRLKIEAAVNDETTEKVIGAVQEIGKDMSVGGGKIFIMPLEECVRARTGQRGSDAINV